MDNTGPMRAIIVSGEDAAWFDFWEPVFDVPFDVVVIVRGVDKHEIQAVVPVLRNSVSA